jgi:hypothetical protein
MLRPEGGKKLILFCAHQNALFSPDGGRLERMIVDDKFI